MRKIFLFISLLILCLSSLLARQYETKRLNYQIDETTGTYDYYSFVFANDRDESWFIQRVSAGGSSYVQGTSSTTYEVAWSSRTAITYTDPFNMYKSKYTP